MLGLGRVSGTLRVRKADLTMADSLSSSTLHVVLDAASFNTGNPKRDTAVRSAKYLDVAAFPDITFDSQEIRREDMKWVVIGTVTAHGVASPADLSVDEIRDNAGELTIRATKIDRYAHHVTAGKGLAARWLTVEITATVVPHQAGG
jgi:polyisoprenoid-binding protein YceI